MARERLEGTESSGMLRPRHKAGGHLSLEVQERKKSIGVHEEPDLPRMR